MLKTKTNPSLSCFKLFFMQNEKNFSEKLDWNGLTLENCFNQHIFVVDDF